MDADFRRRTDRFHRRDRRCAEQSAHRSTSAAAKPTCGPTSPTATASTNRRTRGKTWAHIGLDDTRQIGSIVVDPRNADVAYVAALGHQYGPNAERGVFKTIDGGKTWSKVLYKDPDTGAIALALDPSDPNVLYAALWATRRPPWNVYPPSNGPGSGLFKSTDAGATWTHLSAGLPAKVGPHRHRNLAGESRARVRDGRLRRRTRRRLSFRRCGREPGRTPTANGAFGSAAGTSAASPPIPKTPDVVYVMNTSTYRSTDGGKSFDARQRRARRRRLSHAVDRTRRSVAHDSRQRSRRRRQRRRRGRRGVRGTTSRPGSSITSPPTTAFRIWVYGAQQDSGAGDAADAQQVRRTFRTGTFIRSTPAAKAAKSRRIPSIPGSSMAARVTAERVDTGWELNVDPTLNYPDTLWRNTWTLPIVFSPADPNALYASHQKIFRSRDGGKTWQIV